MRVLLLSMPDSFEHMPTVAIRMPNGALTSLAGNVDPHHRVAVADLILVQRRVRETIERLVQDIEPDLVGLSVMTFQRRTALRIIELIRHLRPAVRVVVGGYDASLAPDAYTDPAAGVDFIVRGEGELTFRELVRAIERGDDLARVAGLSFKSSAGFTHNPDRPVSGLADDAVRLPNRDARVLGARAIFLVDDNITLNVRRFEGLCRAIVEAGLNDLEFTVQAMTSAIANHGRTLAPLMRQAGFRYVFLGIENILEEDLEFLRAEAKNRRRGEGASGGNAAVTAIETLHQNKMYVVGGLIVGNPQDTRESIEANLDFVRRYIDVPYIQHPTPYPRTPMTKAFRDQGLIINERLEEYDGTTAVVRTAHLESDEIEFLRWQAERWIKLKHLPVALVHTPWFALRNGIKMLWHTFRGTTLRSVLGLEDERRSFERYRALRRAERVYL